MKINFKIFGILFFVFFSFAPQFVHAAYLASDLLGQLDTNDQPVYTKSAANNGPNNRGMNFPDGSVIDTTHHRLFISESNNSRVLVFNLDSSNNLIDHLPDNVLGQPDFSTRVTAITRQGMNGPQGLAYDSARDYLFVSDYNNNRILVYDVASITNGEDAINVLGQVNFISNGSATTQGGMFNPFRLAYDAVNQRLFVAEASNSRVLVFDLTVITDGENAVNVLGQANFTSSGAATTQSGMSFPSGLAYDASNTRLFVSEFSNNRVLVFDVASITNGQNAINVLGQTLFTTATAATTQSGMSGPIGLAYDSAHKRLFVGERTNNRVLVFDVTTSTITNGENASFVLGQTNFTNLLSVTTQGGIIKARDMAYDSGNQRLYVPEEGNHRVMIFDVTSITNGQNAIDLLGQLDINNQPVYTKNVANDGPSNRGFNNVLDSVLDSVHHRLFVSEDSNRRVLVFNLDANNNLIDRVADNVLGQPDFTTLNTTVSINTIVTAAGIAYDSVDNRLFVADRGAHRVLVYDVASITNGEDAINVLGQTLFTTSGTATTQNGMNLPQGDLEYDTANKRLFVIDRGNNRVLVYNLSGGITNGMNASYVLGQTLFTTAAAATTQSGISNPVGLAYDSSNQRLFISDGGNNRITVWDVNTATISSGENASYVLGQTLFTTAVATTTQSGLSAPQELGFDPNTNRLFVPDFSNRRFVVYNVATSSIANGENAVAVFGQDNFTSNISSTSQSGIGAGPVSALFDAGNNRLYALDFGNRRIMIYNFLSLPPTALSNAYIQRDYTQVVPTNLSRGTVSVSVVSGSLPPGLSTSGSNIVGQATTEGTYTFSLIANDDNGSIGSFVSQPQSYTIVVTKASNHSAHYELPTSSGTNTPPVFNNTSSNSTFSVSNTPPIPGTLPQSPAVSSSTFTRTLHLKDIGDDVKQLQIYLNTHGFSVATTGLGSQGKETTKFGVATYKAVVKFQRANKLTPDGIFGAKARAVVNGK